MTTAQNCGKVVSLTHRPLLPPGYTWYSFLLEAVSFTKWERETNVQAAHVPCGQFRPCLSSPWSGSERQVGFL